MEDALLRIDSSDGGKEDMKTIFQAVHALKEAAEFFGCTHVVPFALSVENMLGRLLDYEIQPTDKLITRLFLCCDLLRGLVSHLPLNNVDNFGTDISDLVEYFTTVDDTAMSISMGVGAEVNHRMASGSVVGQIINLAA
jgi:chemotaxis protein histidine kinase CheA